MMADPADQRVADDNTSSDTEKSRAKSALRDLHKSLQKIKEKEAYREAVRIAPHLVRVESDLVSFIRCERYDSGRAARRVVKYWETRKQAFGEERAFLPLDLTGEGALHQEDIKLLDTGFFAFLPDDSQQRNVVCLDPSRLPLEYRNRQEAIMRVCFFVLYVLALSPNALSDGFVLVTRAQQVNKQCKVWTVFSKLVQSAFHVRLESIHLVCCPREEEKIQFLETTLPAILQKIGAYLKKFTVVHLVECEKKALEALQGHGLSKENLPQSLGGTWLYDAFTKQLEEKYFAQLPGDSAGSASNEQPLDVLKLVASVLDEENKESTISYDTASDLAMPCPRVQVDEDTTAVETNTKGFDLTVDGIKSKPTVHLNQEENKCSRKASETCFKDRESLDEALEMIPDDEKVAYTEAVRFAPKLIETESNPEIFMQHDKYNAWAAACRLVTYWRNRKEIFGPRAFLLPMTQTGEGALSQDDITILKTGYLSWLPCDTSGRCVLFFDPSRLLQLKEDDRPGRLRCLFYMLTVALENEKSYQDGVVGVGIFDFKSLDRVRGLSAAETIHTFPVTFLFLHAVFSPGNSATGIFLSIFARVFLKLFGAGRNRVKAHTGGIHELPKKLRAFGLTKEGLPVTIGGCWSYDNFSKWQHERQLVESGRHRQLPLDFVHVGQSSVASVLESLSSFRKQATPPNGIETPAHRAPEEKDAVLSRNSFVDMETKEEKRLRKRRKEMIYARRKRERQKARVVALQAECSRLTGENGALKKEFGRLKNLNFGALKEVAKVLGTSAPEVAQSLLAVESLGSIHPAATTMQFHIRRQPISLDRLPLGSLVTPFVPAAVLDQAGAGVQVEPRIIQNQQSIRSGALQSIPGAMANITWNPFATDVPAATAHLGTTTSGRLDQQQGPNIGPSLPSSALPSLPSSPLPSTSQQSWNEVASQSLIQQAGFPVPATHRPATDTLASPTATPPTNALSTLIASSSAGREFSGIPSSTRIALANYWQGVMETIEKRKH